MNCTRSTYPAIRLGAELNKCKTFCTVSVCFFFRYKQKKRSIQNTKTTKQSCLPVSKQPIQSRKEKGREKKLLFWVGHGSFSYVLTRNQSEVAKIKEPSKLYCSSIQNKNYQRRPNLFFFSFFRFLLIIRNRWKGFIRCHGKPRC